MVWGQHAEAQQLARHATNPDLDEHEREKHAAEYRSITCASMLPSAILLSLLGALSVYYSFRHPPGDPCPMPLSTVLFYLGVSYLLNAALMIMTPFMPILYMLTPCTTLAVQIFGLTSFVLALISYANAEKCGEELWWASLLLGNLLIGCCVYCCCSPFGQAKAAALFVALFSKSGVAGSGASAALLTDHGPKAGAAFISYKATTAGSGFAKCAGTAATHNAGYAHLATSAQV